MDGASCRSGSAGTATSPCAPGRATVPAPAPEVNGRNTRRAEMRRFIVTCSVAALALGGTTACATKKMVRQRVGEVNDKVETLSQSLEETQQRTKANETKIGEVDQRAVAANQR